jgi:hypothetical protein
MNRQEHLQWSKDRALEYIDKGEVQNAYTSMASDLGKHPETEGHIAIDLGIRMMMGGLLNTPDEMRKFIEGFN